jgi:hypothetical protein
MVPDIIGLEKWLLSAMASEEKLVTGATVR